MRRRLAVEVAALPHETWACTEPVNTPAWTAFDGTARDYLREQMKGTLRGGKPPPFLPP